MTNPYVPAKIGVVVNEPGFGDLSVADQVLTGLEELGGDVVVDYEYFTAENAADAGIIIEDLSASRSYDLIVVIGGELAGELASVASSYPNQKYACIGGEVVADNVFSTTFKQNEAAFLAGVQAAMVSIGDENRTGTGIIGIIGSISTDPTVISLIDGFKQGVRYANESLDLEMNITLLPDAYVNSYNNSGVAELIALNMFNPFIGDASVIFAPVRASLMGVREAMLTANSTFYQGTDRQPLVIAAQGDQDYLGLPDINTFSGSSWVITSIVPRSDLAVYRAINSTLWDEFSGATLEYTLSHAGDDAHTPGVILTRSEFINYEWTPRIILDTVDDIRQAVINGTIVVANPP